MFSTARYLVPGGKDFNEDLRLVDSTSRDVVLFTDRKGIMWLITDGRACDELAHATALRVGSGGRVGKTGQVGHQSLAHVRHDREALGIELQPRRQLLDDFCRDLTSPDGKPTKEQDGMEHDSRGN